MSRGATAAVGDTDCNIVVLRGRRSSDPRVRTLPSGARVTQLEVTTPRADGAATVPVAVHDRELAFVGGDEVVVVDHVRRQFSRAGGHTSSRTGVVAARVVPARRRSVERALASAVAALRAGAP